jgi:hypothetical protein
MCFYIYTVIPEIDLEKSRQVYLNLDSSRTFKLCLVSIVYPSDLLWGLTSGMLLDFIHVVALQL